MRNPAKTGARREAAAHGTSSSRVYSDRGSARAKAHIALRIQGRCEADRQYRLRGTPEERKRRETRSQSKQANPPQQGPRMRFFPSAGTPTRSETPLPRRASRPPKEQAQGGQ